MPRFIKNIQKLAQIAHYPAPKYPQLALLKIEHFKGNLAFMPQSLTLGFYTIGLKKHLKGYLKYGRKQYDFQEGVLLFTGINQVINYENLILEESEGWYLLFEKSLLVNTPLEKSIERYHFFDYNIDEALHLSEGEEAHLQGIFASLDEEYHKPIDTFSKELLVSHLQMILMYSERYYKRQFITRQDGDASLLIRFEEVLQEACALENLSKAGIPSVKNLAEQMHLSSKYLSDALRNLTGIGTQKHIHLRLVELAKTQLLHHHQNVSEVAFKLGFESHTYFSRFFKKMEGISPKEFVARH
ncbi:MAG: helix-turn-helix transcriptional regulator [Bacteroidota bacterium]